jgi:hypothetical protein
MAHHFSPLQQPFCENSKVQASSNTATVEAQFDKLWSPYDTVSAKLRSRRNDSIVKYTYSSSLEAFGSVPE